jgi:hypothetical protein
MKTYLKTVAIILATVAVASRVPQVGNIVFNR